MSAVAGARTRTIILALLVAAAGCTGERPQLTDAVATTTSTTSATPSSSTTEPEPGSVEIATANGDQIDIYPGEDASEPARTLTAGQAVTAPDQTPIVFLVKSHGDERLEVYLPTRPNGSTGWISTDDVELTSTTFEVVVDLGMHRLRVLDGDEVVVDQAVGVGRQDRPTPGGVYYLKELLQPPEPDGVYGAYAYGLSGFSNVLESFNGGEGVIGIHGTNQPELVGQDVSSGCIRLPNDAITRLVEDIGLPLGTPVEIRA